jgi:hypothetical protein
MADSRDGTGIVIGVGLIALLWAWWSGASKTAAMGVASTAGTITGNLGCGGCGSQQTYIPTTPATGRPVIIGSPVKALPGASATLLPPAAPGGNSNTSGSGAQWQAVQTNAQTSLTPNYAPKSPSAPVGNGVWQAHVNAPRVTA